MAPTLFLEAFGELAPHRAVREAALTAGRDAARLGWVQVGLALGESRVVRPGGLDWLPRIQIPGHPARRRRAVEPARALPALTQCLDDALGRFGGVALSGLQVTATGLEPRPPSDAGPTGHPGADLLCGLDWFRPARPAPVEALIAVDHELLGSHAAADLAARLPRWNTAAFAFGPVTTVPAPHAVQVPLEVGWWYSIAAGRGVTVALPEWTASAVAWVLAAVIDTARALTPEVRNGAVRVTRVR